VPDSTVPRCYQKGYHIVARSALLLDRPQQLSIVAQRTQTIDTLPVHTGLGTMAVAG
jgi:hypothetical protein